IEAYLSGLGPWELAEALDDVADAFADAATEEGRVDRPLAEEIDGYRRALRATAPVLAEDPAYLPSQLLARLPLRLARLRDRIARHNWGDPW
ncbi:hypothetical protein, partial [Salmonella sp. SAL4360]|uniref:hypothetical protein n=1 Tax=Salmonella sp. SAL4360 TaxID=3159881 RepID=UPI00397ABEE4